MKFYFFPFDILKALPLALSVFLFQHAVVAQEPFSVDLELVLLVDVSQSIDSSEYNLQRQGYADAFRNPEVQSAILSGAQGKIAVTMIFWSSGSRIGTVLDWTLVDSVSSASTLAEAIELIPRQFTDSQTLPDRAVNFVISGNSGASIFDGNGFDAARRVIDISADGPNQFGEDRIARAINSRDTALAEHVDAINALVISSKAKVYSYYADFLVGGVGSFIAQVDDFQGFSEAIADKLVAEIAPLEETCEEDYLFWTPSVTGSTPVFRTALEGGQTEQIATFPFLSVRHVSVDQANQLLYLTNQNGVFRTDLEGLMPVELFVDQSVTGSDNFNGALAIPGTEQVIVADFSRIGIYDTEQSGFEVLASQRQRRMDIDLESEFIFTWRALGGSAPSIQKISFDGQTQIDIVSASVGGFSNLNRPQDVKVDPVNEKVYISVADGRILRCDFDGGNLETIVSGLAEVFGIEIDEVRKKLYWADLTEGTITQANLDGSSPSVFLTHTTGISSISLGTASGAAPSQWIDFSSGSVDVEGLTVTASSGGTGFEMRQVPATEEPFVSQFGTETTVAVLEGSTTGAQVAFQFSSPLPSGWFLGVFDVDGNDSVNKRVTLSGETFPAPEQLRTQTGNSSFPIWNQANQTLTQASRPLDTKQEASLFDISGMSAFTVSANQSGAGTTVGLFGPVGCEEPSES
ncbi:MAG: DUF1194 domain-containing protein, partial [Verrucomicrobiota bacterium]